MTKSRILILLVAAMMIFGLAACNGNDTPATSVAPPVATSAAAGDPTAAPDDPPAPLTGELTELVWITNNPGVVPPQQKEVEDYLNAISEPEVGVKVSWLYNTGDQTELAVSAGDPWDLVFTCDWYFNYAVNATRGYFADITDKVQTVTPDLYAHIPEIVWAGSLINDKIYALPTYKDVAAANYIRFDKARVVDELGYEIINGEDKYNTLDSITPILADLKAAYPDETPINITRTFGQTSIWIDYIMRDEYIGLSYATMEPTVISAFEDPSFLAQHQTYHEWWNAGYVNQDAPVTDEQFTYSAIKFGQGYPGAETIWTTQDGYEQVISLYSGPWYSTSSIRGSMNAINARLDDATVDKALLYLQLVNLNPDYRNGLAYGIPGVHCELQDDGTVKMIDQENYMPARYTQASNFAGLWVESPSSPTAWEDCLALMERGQASDALGFSYDPSQWEAQMAVQENMRASYMDGILTGQSDPVEVFPQLIAELEGADYREMIADVQAKLDEYLAATAQ